METIGNGSRLIFQTLDTDTCEGVTDDSFVIDVASIHPDDAAVLDECDHYGTLTDQGRAIVRTIGVPIAELWAAYQWRESLRRDGVLGEIENHVVRVYEEFDDDQDYDNAHRCRGCGVTGGGVTDGMCQDCDDYSEVECPECYERDPYLPGNPCCWQCGFNSDVAVQA